MEDQLALRAPPLAYRLPHVAANWARARRAFLGGALFELLEHELCRVSPHDDPEELQS